MAIKEHISQIVSGFLSDATKAAGLSKQPVLAECG